MSSSLRSKVQRLVALETDSPEMLEALDSVSQFYGDAKDGAASRGRSSLRADLSRKNYALACQFLQGLDRIRERLEGAQQAVVALEDGSQHIHTRIQAASQSMMTFLEEATRLERERDALREQAAKIEAFLEQYQLRESEIAALHREPIESQQGEPFFAALDRLDVIRVETNRLVGSEHQGTGFELLDALSAHQEKAFARLYAWVQEEVANLDSEAAEADPVMQRAVKTLYGTPTFYKHCQEIVIGVRRGTVVKNFVAALSYKGPTAGDPGSRRSRPLDVHANDPVRYASDMLAWTHQCVVTERELVRSLFHGSAGGHAEAKESKAGREEVGAGNGGPAGDEAPLSNQDMLREILDGLGPPLEMRVAQVVESGSGHTLDAFKLSGLLAFYHVTLLEMLGDSSSVVTAIFRCRQQVYTTFLRLLASLGQEVTDHLQDCLRNISGGSDPRGAGASTAREGAPLLSLDLQPSGSLKETLGTLTIILDVSRTALTPPTELEADVSPVLDAFLRPFAGAQQAFLERAAKEMQTAAAASGVRLFSESFCDEAIFLMNSFITAGGILGPAPGDAALADPAPGALEASRTSLAHWASMLGDGIGALRQVIVDFHSRRILERTGLGALLAAREQALAGADAAVLSSHPTLSLEAVRGVVEAFNNALFTIFVPDFERIADLDQKNQARIETMTRVADGYQTVYDMVTDATHGYTDRSFLVHDPQQVRVLLC